MSGTLILNKRSHLSNTARKHRKIKPPEATLTFALNKVAIFKKTISPTGSDMDTMIGLLTANLETIMASLGWSGITAHNSIYTYDLDAHPTFTLGNGTYGGTSLLIGGVSGYVGPSNFDEFSPYPNPTLCYCYIRWYLFVKLTSSVSNYDYPLANLNNPWCDIPGAVKIYHTGQGDRSEGTDDSFISTINSASLLAKANTAHGTDFFMLPVGYAVKDVFVLPLATVIPPNDVDGSPPAGARCIKPPIIASQGLQHVQFKHYAPVPIVTILHYTYFQESYFHVVGPGIDPMTGGAGGSAGSGAGGGGSAGGDAGL